ncbi:hypothetical protein KSP40_PGU008575 [Platanthera guangdongensis]|uniref:Uncharacterized protein n=1 Tax=Platanthera guangdongensis TaxID=2320717 RepID=A0ABR2M989_9ASPA
MRAGQYLVMRSSQPPPLPSLLRPVVNGLVFSSYPPSSAPSPRWIRRISLFSGATIGGSTDEWKLFRLPRSKFPASIPFPLPAGRCVWNLCSSRAYQASDSSASIDSNTMETMENKDPEKGITKELDIFGEEEDGDRAVNTNAEGSEMPSLGRYGKKTSRSTEDLRCNGKESLAGGSLTEKKLDGDYSLNMH